jgi:hypothetical protein
MRRFTLRLPCLIHHWSDTREELLVQTMTRNVSTGGALVETDGPLPPGIRVQCNLLVQRSGRLSGVGGGSCIRLSGRVVRAGTDEMGVTFGEDYRIVRTSHLWEQYRAVLRWLEQWEAMATGQPDRAVA